MKKQQSGLEQAINQTISEQTMVISHYRIVFNHDQPVGLVDDKSFVLDQSKQVSTTFEVGGNQFIGDITMITPEQVGAIAQYIPSKMIYGNDGTLNVFAYCNPTLPDHVRPFAEGYCLMIIPGNNKSVCYPAGAKVFIDQLVTNHGSIDHVVIFSADQLELLTLKSEK